MALFRQLDSLLLALRPTLAYQTLLKRSFTRQAALCAEGDVVNGAQVFEGKPEIVEGPDSEYPEWLWELTKPAPEISELDPKQDKLYWIKTKKETIRNDNALRSQLS
eukprot:m.43223 g.43223  ORF g.43223 m.43223 type:complete len:107 (+) comp12911_c0_seq8:1055-1375(+)